MKLLIAVPLLAGMAAGPHPLTDKQMDRVTAGAALSICCGPDLTNLPGGHTDTYGFAAQLKALFNFTPVTPTWSFADPGLGSGNGAAPKITFPSPN